jgi:rare lipoprotein A
MQSIMTKRYLLIVFCLLILLSGPVFGQESGKASYYADRFHGEKTASGELYDMAKFTAAHRTLPFGTYVKVTRIDNNKSVIVRVNDRGPHKPDRVIDISKAAAVQIDLVRAGVANVKLEILRPGEESNPVPVVTSGIPDPVVAPDPNDPASDLPPDAVPISEILVKPTDNTPKPVENRPVTVKPPTDPNIRPPVQPPPVPDEPMKADGLYNFHASKVETSGYGIQIGAFSSYRNVLELMDNLHAKSVDFTMLYVTTVDKKAFFKVILGPFPTKEAADAYLTEMRKKELDGLLIDLKTLK